MAKINAALGQACVIFQEDDYGRVLLGTYKGTPPATADQFAIGCRLMDETTGWLYTNFGTVAAPVWVNEKDREQVAVANLTAADIVATAAGSLSHANGLTLVPAPGVGYALELVSCIVSYTRVTATLTGGGNVTVNWGAGGAAITGLVSAANSFAKASSNINQFVPLSTAGNNVVTNAALSLVTASAITQPGTAAGTAKITTVYRTHAV
jgi:hypothetical protein